MGNHYAYFDNLELTLSLFLLLVKCVSPTSLAFYEKWVKKNNMLIYNSQRTGNELSF